MLRNWDLVETRYFILGTGDVQTEAINEITEVVFVYFSNVYDCLSYHEYVDGEFRPYSHSDDQDDRYDSAQRDVGQTHKPEQLHHHHYDYLHNKEDHDIIKSTT